MQSADQLDLESHKLVNSLYEMRYFIYKIIHQPEKVFDQLHEAAPASVINIQTVNIEFKKLFRKEGMIDQKQIDDFLNSILGEEVGEETYRGGLLQNKVYGIYNFLNDPKNKAKKQFLLENLSKLNDAWLAWQTYDITHTNLAILFKECNDEMNKIIIRADVAALMRENKKTKTQPPIIKPLLNTPIPVKPAPAPILLENPEALPCTTKLLRALAFHESKFLAKYIQFLLETYEKLKQLPNTFNIKIKFDKYIIYALIHTQERYLSKYCKLILDNIPEGFMLGKEWPNNTFSAKDKTTIIQYWQQFAELITNHLQHFSNEQLAQLIIKLRGIPGEEDQNEDAQSIHTHPDDSENDLDFSQSPSKKQKDLPRSLFKENLPPIELPVLPQDLRILIATRTLANRTKSDITTELGRHRRNTLFAVPTLNRASSSSCFPEFNLTNPLGVTTPKLANNEITVGNDFSLKRKRS